jgi:hypothetical protein
MTGKVSAPPAVRRMIKEAKDALASRNLEQPLSTQCRPVENVDHWKVSSKPIPVTIDSKLEGEWTLRMNWLFTPIPLGEPEIVESSVGLYVRGAKRLGASEVCLVRYDVDNDAPGTGLAPLGPHLNVIQPGPLCDKVHYPVPGVDGAGWAIGIILDILLSDRLARDLVKHLK